jgi:hypothetical protein
VALFISYKVSYNWLCFKNNRFLDLYRFIIIIIIIIIIIMPTIYLRVLMGFKTTAIISPYSIN